MKPTYLVLFVEDLVASVQQVDLGEVEMGIPGLVQLSVLLSQETEPACTIMRFVRTGKHYPALLIIYIHFDFEPKIVSIYVTKNWLSTVYLIACSVLVVRSCLVAICNIVVHTEPLLELVCNIFIPPTKFEWVYRSQFVCRSVGNLIPLYIF